MKKVPKIGIISLLSVTILLQYGVTSIQIYRLEGPGSWSAIMGISKSSEIPATNEVLTFRCENNNISSTIPSENMMFFVTLR